MGKSFLEILNPAFELKSGLDGVIREVSPNWSVVVESFGCLLQGVWGNGRISSGLLVNTVKTENDEFNRASVDVTMRGAIVAGSYCCRQEALGSCGGFFTTRFDPFQHVLFLGRLRAKYGGSSHPIGRIWIHPHESDGCQSAQPVRPP